MRWELSLEKPRHVIFLIPFRLDDCQIPRYLGSRQWGDYFGENKENTYKTLLRSLKQRHQQKLQLEVEEDVERQTAEKLAREKAEHTALKRAKQEAIEEEREKFKRETAARLAQEKVERDATEKIAHEKEERKKAEREKIELAQAKQTEKEKLEKQKIKPVMQPARAIEKKREKAGTPTPKLNVRTLGIGGIIFACLLLVVFGGNYLFKNNNSAPAEPPIAAKTKTPAQTSTSEPPTFMPAPGIGSTQVSKKDGMTLVFVPEGEFTMGESSDEPKVNLDAFWIDKTEVTNAMYAECVIEGDCTSPSFSNSYTHDSYYSNSEFADYPVIFVDWNQANAYCSWAGRRLPTEAEWEKAARSTDGRMYPWGNESPNSNLLNYNNNVGDTTEVGKYKEGASIYGALDMAGNVWEWMSSLYQDYPYNKNDGREDLTASGSRVLRGGSWNRNDTNARSSNRGTLHPEITLSSLGFRCSLSP